MAHAVRRRALLLGFKLVVGLVTARHYYYIVECLKAHEHTSTPRPKPQDPRPETRDADQTLDYVHLRG
jgi:hypothetical protein